jgi:hypothetical protein
MDPDEEKKSELFSELFVDVLEYREAFAMLQQYEIGFVVTSNRYWHGGDILPTFMLTIAKLPPEKGKKLLWIAKGSADNFLKAVRLVVHEAAQESVAYQEKKEKKGS